MSSARRWRRSSLPSSCCATALRRRLRHSSRSWCCSLERGTLRLTQLIDNLLESVRIEAGQLDIRQQSIDLPDVIDDAAGMVEALLRQRAQRSERQLDGRPRPAGRCPATDTGVREPARQCQQVRAGEHGHPRRRAPRGRNSSSPGWRTRAPGLPAGTQESVFERFSRGGTEPAPGGMGLGLSISRSIVERHGGSIGASRTADGLTRFDIAAPDGIADMKILVADDDPDLLDLVAYALGQAGYLVVKAADGTSAIELFDAEAPDIAILDINMPGLPGSKSVRAIRSRSHRAHHDAHGARRGAGPGARAGPGRRRLPHQAFQPAHPAGSGAALLRRARVERTAGPLTAGRVTLDAEASTVARRRRASR